MFNSTMGSIVWLRGVSRRSTSRPSAFFPPSFSKHCRSMTSLQHQITKHDNAHAEARRFFDDLWSRGDPWALEMSPYEDHRYRLLLDSLSDRHYDKVLEIGCGAGAFTRRLAAR